MKVVEQRSCGTPTASSTSTDDTTGRTRGKSDKKRDRASAAVDEPASGRASDDSDDETEVCSPLRFCGFISLMACLVSVALGSSIVLARVTANRRRLPASRMPARVHLLLLCAFAFVLRWVVVPNPYNCHCRR